MTHMMFFILGSMFGAAVGLVLFCMFISGKIADLEAQIAFKQDRIDHLQSYWGKI